MKDYKFYRKRAKISSIITLTVILPLAVYAFILLENSAEISRGSWILLLSALAVALTSFVFSEHYDRKAIECRKKAEDKQKNDEFAHVCDLIEDGKKEDAIVELITWRKKYNA